MLDVGELPLVGQVATSSWSLHTKSPNCARWQLLSILVKDTCLIARYHFASGTGANFGTC